MSYLDDDCVSKYMNTDKLRLIMKAFINAQFGYYPLVWMFHSRTLNNRINKLHIVFKNGYGRRTYFDKFECIHLSGAGSSPAGSVGRYLNLQKLDYQYLTTSVAVVLVVR